MEKGIISRNIGLLMEHFNIRNESQLAKQVGMPQTTVNKLISGVSTDPRISTLTPLAKHFQISLDTLLNENPIFGKPNENQSLDLLIPLVTYNELIEIYTNLDSLTPVNWPNWYPIPKQKNKNYYALYLNPQQFLSPFDQASILIIKNDSILLNNCYSLLKHLKSETITPKKIISDNGQRWLLALQPEIPPSKFTNKNWKSLGIIEYSIIDISKNSITLEGGKG